MFLCRITKITSCKWSPLMRFPFARSFLPSKFGDTSRKTCVSVRLPCIFEPFLLQTHAHTQRNRAEYRENTGITTPGVTLLSQHETSPQMHSVFFYDGQQATQIYEHHGQNNLVLSPCAHPYAVEASTTRGKGRWFEFQRQASLHFSARPCREVERIVSTGLYWRIEKSGRKK